MFNLYRKAVRTAIAAGVLGLLMLIVAVSTSVGTSFAYSSPQGATAFRFTTLNDQADPTFNQLLGINDHGVIAGYFGSGARGHPNQGYTIKPPYGQGNHTSENFPGSVQTQVTAIDNIGNTAGFWVDGHGNNFGFIEWNGVFTSYKNPNTGKGTVNQLLGINDKGIAVGFYTDSKGINHAYELNQQTKKFTAIVPPGGKNALATGINDNGDVVGVMSFHRGDFTEATAYYQEGLALARQIGLHARACLILSNLGEAIVEQGDYVQAEQHIREGISLVHQTENRNYLATLLSQLGGILGLQGNYEQANASFGESLEIVRSQGSLWYTCKTLAEWGEIHIKYRQLDDAEAVFQEVLVNQRDEGGDQELLARAWYGLARVAALRGEASEAAQLGQKGEAQFEKIGHYKAREVREWLLSL